MFEKVNPGHPDKMADRLSGAIVDLVYERAGGLTKANPRVACEVMAGHGRVDVQIETSLGRLDLANAELAHARPSESEHSDGSRSIATLTADDIYPLIHRLFGERVEGNVLIAPQDPHLSDNQTHGLRCGDNGIFKGCPPTEEQRVLTAIAATMWENFKSDGKYLLGRYLPNLEKAIGERGRDQIVPSDEDTRSYAVTICQSNATYDEILKTFHDFFEGNGGGKVSPHVSTLKAKDGLTKYYSALINPLGPWTGGIDVDCGCTNRKLGSDLGDGVTGGGLMGKDLSKADVSVNIVCYLKAVASGQVVTAICSIGDENVTFTYADGRRETERFADIVEQARLYIMTDCGGSFERFAEWGLVRPQAQV